MPVYSLRVAVEILQEISMLPQKQSALAAGYGLSRRRRAYFDPLTGLGLMDSADGICKCTPEGERVVEAYERVAAAYDSRFLSTDLLVLRQLAGRNAAGIPERTVHRAKARLIEKRLVSDGAVTEEGINLIEQAGELFPLAECLHVA